MLGFDFDGVRFPPAAEEARTRVRAFLEAERAAGRIVPHRGTWSTFDAGFTRRLGEAGFIGVTWPKVYGGQEASSLARFVITEEMLAAGAPCAAHWVADRQSGPQILKHGTERAKQEILPAICRGECTFGIGMSEPGSGSDLASVRTRATLVDGGWRIDGQKIWTTNAHNVTYLIVLARTGDAGPSRHEGLTQFIVRMDSPGIEVRGIQDMAGNHEFNEVFFDGCFVPNDMMLGKEGSGWDLVTGELAFERSGPDRFLSDFQLFVALVDKVGPTPDRMSAVEIGRMFSELSALRRMSTSIAGMLDEGAQPLVEAAIVKDLGTSFEQALPETARRLVPEEADRDTGEVYGEALAETMLRAPCFSLRGGTREILRGMIARGIGLR